MCVSPKDDGFSEWFHHSLHHGTIDLLGWVFICWGDVLCVVGCPAAPLAPLPSMDDGVTHPPTLSLWQSIVSWCCQMSPGCHSCPWLRTTVIDEQEYHIFSHFGIQTGYESPKPFHEGLWSKSYPEFAGFSSVAQSHLTLCDPMNRSTPGLPVHHQLPESTQTHVHCVGDAIQPSHPLFSPSPPALNLSQHQGLFQWASSLHQVAKAVSASTSVLPMNTQD